MVLITMALKILISIKMKLENSRLVSGLVKGAHPTYFYFSLDYKT